MTKERKNEFLKFNELFEFEYSNLEFVLKIFENFKYFCNGFWNFFHFCLKEETPIHPKIAEYDQ